MSYVIQDKGVDNICVRDLDSSSGRQVMNFTTEHIVEFRWSPDGKTLAVVRSHDTSELVLVRGK